MPANDARRKKPPSDAAYKKSSTARCTLAADQYLLNRCRRSSSTHVAKRNTSARTSVESAKHVKNVSRTRWISPPWQRREIDSQRKYIDALEQLAVGGGAQDSVPPGTALMLRQQNKLLVTKCAAAGPAPRRARRVAQRAAGQRAVALRASQHARARARTLRATAGGARKAERSERLQAQNARLRSQLRERDQQLVSSGRRIAELEQLVVSLRTVLRQSVRGIALAGLEPDPPLLQGPAVNLA